MTASGTVTYSPARDYDRIRHACSLVRGVGSGWNSLIPTMPIEMHCSRGQKRVSRQLWHLGSKIMEVDTFLRANPFVRNSRSSP